MNRAKGLWAVAIVAALVSANTEAQGHSACNSEYSPLECGDIDMPPAWGEREERGRNRSPVWREECHMIPWSNPARYICYYVRDNGNPRPTPDRPYSKGGKK
jgi:hypothetical protein